MIGKYIPPEIRKERMGQLWFLADRWFRILEFSLILGTLGYFKERHPSISISIIYWISWAVFFAWVDEVGEFLGDSIDKKQKRNWMTFTLTTCIVIFYYLVVTQTLKLIIQ
jgi:hypothetical protein